MDFITYQRLIRIADNVESIDYEVPAGTIMTCAVSLQKITSEGLEGTETVWVVVRSGNPLVVVVHTEDEALAHRTYADEIDRARKAQSERVMWRR